MKTPFLKIGLQIALVQLSLFVCQTGLAAVGFTVTPSAISNTYSGMITLQVTGLSSGGAVVVQKFLDANGSGVIDAGDLLVQQFNLTDGQAGMVIGGVTNINVPGDTDTTAGQITATLNFQNGDFVQNIVGTYLIKLSSPTGAFAPQTNSFTVTNFPFAQKITGNVVSNSAAAPNAVILLFGPPRNGDHGPGTPVAETVANNSGNYTVQVPPGTYVPLAFKSACVADYSASPVLTLSDGQTIHTNLALTNATSTISGRMVDAANNSIGLPGIFMPVNQNALIAFGFTDTNGNFSIGVRSGTWGLGGDNGGFIVHGYVGYQGGTNVNAGSTGVILAIPQATALFYGTVKDNLGNPLAGIDVSAQDNNGNGTFQADGYSDANGHYVVGVVGGLGGTDTWQAQVSSDNSPANYLFSQQFDQQNGTNIAVGVAVHQNFTAVLATNVITGNVKHDGTNLVGVGVSAYATINGQEFNVSADTDGSGNYSLNVANSNVWNVSVFECCDNDSLDNILGSGNYQPPSSQNVGITNGNSTANFVVQDCNGVQINTTSLPNGTNGDYYDTVLEASSCSGNINWSINSGSLPSGLNLDTDGELHGMPNSTGTFNFSVHADDGNGHSADQSLSLIIQGCTIQILTDSPLPNATNGVSYFIHLQASGCNNNFTWSLNDPSDFPSSLNMNLDSSGDIFGSPSGTGSFTFSVHVQDNSGNSADKTFSLTITGPLQITTTSLPNGTNTLFYSQTLQASGGTPPYNWSIPNYSDDPPPNLILATNGVLSGTLSTSTGGYNFDVQVTDANSTTVYQPLQLYVYSAPLPPMIITNTSLPNGTVGVAYSAQLGATGGQPPYFWQLAAGSANLPTGLSLNSSGLISGTPTTNKVSTFKVQVTDSSVSDPPTNKVLSITIVQPTTPTISSPAHFSNGQFQMTVSSTAGITNTVQMTTNLTSANWIPVLITNPSSGSFQFNDGNATNQQRFYRVLIGP